MKIKIVKSRKQILGHGVGSLYWYSKCVGETFDVDNKIYSSNDLEELDYDVFRNETNSWFLYRGAVIAVDDTNFREKKLKRICDES